MVNCGKDTNGSQFNFQEPCQWLIVVKILMVQFNFQEPCQLGNGGKDTNGSV